MLASLLFDCLIDCCDSLLLLLAVADVAADIEDVVDTITSLWWLVSGTNGLIVAFPLLVLLLVLMLVLLQQHENE